MRTYSTQTPKGFLFALKVTDAITIYQYPQIARLGERSGKLNPDFLNAEEFRANFLSQLEPIRDKLGPIIFEFSRFKPGGLSRGQEFLALLDRFFTELDDKKDYSFAVEIRNRNWIQRPYFEMLSRHRVAHVFNSWTQMPSLGEQMLAMGDVGMPFFVSRLLLSKNTTYEAAVKQFSPYDRVHNELPEVRRDCVRLIQKALDLGIRAYIFVNNRLEGCAPATIEGIVRAV